VNAKSTTFEAPEASWEVGCVEAVSHPIGSGLGRVLFPSPEFFLNFWFKMGHFLFSFIAFRQRGGGIAQCLPLNMLLFPYKIMYLYHHIVCCSALCIVFIAKYLFIYQS